jgi:hypothetical protein
LISVISSNKDRKVVREFFELLKPPWECYEPQRSYDVVLSTENKIQKTNSKLLIIYSSDKNRFDDIREIRVQSACRNASVEYPRTEIPIGAMFLLLKESGSRYCMLRTIQKFGGLEIKSEGLRKIASGYDIFEEIDHLLSMGQLKENANERFRLNGEFLQRNLGVW